MNTFVKIFKGYADEVEREINETIRTKNVIVVSVSTCAAYNGALYATVIFEEIGSSSALLEYLQEA